MQTTYTPTEEAARERDAFIERLLQSTYGAFDILTIYMGDRLGFYRDLADGKVVTPPELASLTGTNSRYAREWLEQQAATGILKVEDASAEPEERRFYLPAGHAEVLTERDSLNYLAPLARLVVGAARPMEAILNAYRNGGGVPFHAYGVDLREGQGDINCALFLQSLGEEWLPGIPDLHARLQADPPARIADIGCGLGWSSIGMARAYPNVRVDGFDLDTASIESARENAWEAGLSDRVAFHLCDAGDPLVTGPYDPVTAFECVHDMSNPVGALSAMRRLAGVSGTVIVMDERVAETFMGEGNDVDGMMYGWSVLHCLPAGMADQPSAGTGTVMRPDTLRQYAREAGFRDMEILSIENFFFRFYRLCP